MTEATVRPLFTDQQPGPAAEHEITPTFVEMARVIASIAATRVLLLVTTLTGAAIWLWSAYDPARDRLYVAVAFSVVFVLPQVALYLKKG